METMIRCEYDDDCGFDQTFETFFEAEGRKAAKADDERAEAAFYADLCARAAQND